MATETMSVNIQEFLHSHQVFPLLGYIFFHNFPHLGIVKSYPGILSLWCFFFNLQFLSNYDDSLLEISDF